MAASYSVCPCSPGPPPASWQAGSPPAAASRGARALHSASSVVPRASCWQPCRAGVAPRRFGTEIDVVSHKATWEFGPGRLFGSHAEHGAPASC